MSSFIPDASRRPPPTPQCISFIWGLSREICEKVDEGRCSLVRKTAEVVVKQPQLCFLGCRILGASHIGVVLGPVLWAILKLEQVWPSWALCLEGKLDYREVMLKLMWAMLCHVVLLVLHPEMLSPRQCWQCWHHFGITFGHRGAHVDAMWAQFGGYNPASPKTNPDYTSKTVSPMALEA